MLLIGTELSGERSVDLSLPSDHDSTEGEDDDLGIYFLSIYFSILNENLKTALSSTTFTRNGAEPDSSVRSLVYLYIVLPYFRFVVKTRSTSAAF